ncbi:MAG: hypothetical protein JSS83_28085 [Cyanobacteria bacterium SZAS LIN-3]|nr:hypothetical protein [Cyanobacteria bacterium SZAS LIN-3]MBS2011259.1 hypothetical protein [Cyanobacteria bacterium SZAS TMP-1]
MELNKGFVLKFLNQKITSQNLLGARGDLQELVGLCWLNSGERGSVGFSWHASDLFTLYAFWVFEPIPDIPGIGGQWRGRATT